jgi:hypothetical protein
MRKKKKKMGKDGRKLVSGKVGVRLLEGGVRPFEGSVKNLAQQIT